VTFDGGDAGALSARTGTGRIQGGYGGEGYEHPGRVEARQGRYGTQDKIDGHGVKPLYLETRFKVRCALVFRGVRGRANVLSLYGKDG
jgi:hypothetical protein